MKFLRIAERAKQDLIFIKEYSRKAWGAAQADIYIEDIKSGFALLLEYPEAGRTCDQIRTGCRSLLKARHVIYYEINGDYIDIIGVLHERMDPLKQFSEMI